MKLGDEVARITKALGVKECAGCAKRRKALNLIDPSADAVWSKIYSALMTPEKVIDEENNRSEESNQAGRGGKE